MIRYKNNIHFGFKYLTMCSKQNMGGDDRTMIGNKRSDHIFICDVIKNDFGVSNKHGWDDRTLIENIFFIPSELCPRCTWTDNEGPVKHGEMVVDMLSTVHSIRNAFLLTQIILRWQMENSGDDPNWIKTQSLDGISVCVICKFNLKHPTKYAANDRTSIEIKIDDEDRDCDIRNTYFDMPHKTAGMI